MADRRDDVLFARVPVPVTDFGCKRNVDLGETEMVMRKTTVIYSCDWCGARYEFDGEKLDRSFILDELGKAGWRTIKIGRIGRSSTDFSKHLCPVCMKGFAKYLDKSTPLP